MNYASFGCAMRKVSLLCGVISFGNACGMQLALVGQPPRKSPVVEIARKNFSHAMHHMQKLIPEIQMPIALYVFDHNSEAADKFMQMPLEEKMKDYANAKAIFHKEALRHFGEAAFDPYNKQNSWHVGTIFLSFDDKIGLPELRLVNKMLVHSSYACNKAELRAFLAVAEKFNKINLSRPSIAHDFTERDLRVVCRESYTVANFKEKVSLDQQVGALFFISPCLATFKKPMWWKFGCYSLPVPIMWGGDIFMFTKAGYSLKEAILWQMNNMLGTKENILAAGVLVCMSPGIANYTSFLSCISPVFENELLASSTVLAGYGLACLLYNIKQMANLRSKVVPATTLAEALNDPNIVIS